MYERIELDAVTGDDRIGTGEDRFFIRPDWHSNAACRGTYNQFESAEGDSPLTQEQGYRNAEIMAVYCLACTVQKECANEAKRLGYVAVSIKPTRAQKTRGCTTIKGLRPQSGCNDNTLRLMGVEI